MNHRHLQQDVRSPRLCGFENATLPAPRTFARAAQDFCIAEHAQRPDSLREEVTRDVILVRAMRGFASATFPPLPLVLLCAVDNFNPFALGAVGFGIKV